MEFFKPVQKTLSSNILHETLIFGRVKLSVLLKSKPLIRKKNHHQQQQNKTSKQTNRKKKKLIPQIGQVALKATLHGERTTSGHVSL